MEPKPLISQTLKVFLSADLETVKHRYKNREENSDMAEFEKRLMQDWKAFSRNKHRFDHIVENNSTLQETLEKLLTTIKQKLELLNS